MEYDKGRENPRMIQALLVIEDGTNIVAKRGSIEAIIQHVGNINSVAKLLNPLFLNGWMTMHTNLSIAISRVDKVDIPREYAIRNDENLQISERFHLRATYPTSSLHIMSAQTSTVQ